MKAIATRTLAAVLAALLATSCGTVRDGRQPDSEKHVFLPRAPRVVASPVVDELELRRAFEEILPYVNVEATRAGLRQLVADPRFPGRRSDLSEQLFGPAKFPGGRRGFSRQFEQYKATLSN